MELQSVMHLFSTLWLKHTDINWLDMNINSTATNNIIK